MKRPPSRVAHGEALGPAGESQNLTRQVGFRPWSCSGADAALVISRFGDEESAAARRPDAPDGTRARARILCRVQLLFFTLGARMKIKSRLGHLTTQQRRGSESRRHRQSSRTSRSASRVSDSLMRSSSALMVDLNGGPRTFMALDTCNLLTLLHIVGFRWVRSDPAPDPAIVRHRFMTLALRSPSAQQTPTRNEPASGPAKPRRGSRECESPLLSEAGGVPRARTVGGEG